MNKGTVTGNITAETTRVKTMGIQITRKKGCSQYSQRRIQTKTRGGFITTEKEKHQAETMRRVVEAGEGVKRSSTVHQNTDENEKESHFR